MMRRLIAVLALLFLTHPTAAKEVDIKTVNDYIRQGESHWYTSHISSSTFEVYLVWNNPSSSLTLTVYSPDGVSKTYSDGYDGRIDGKIRVKIADVLPGYWFFRVYGERVEGAQQYSFAVYEG